MCKLLVPLKTTGPTLHRIWVTLDSVESWYAIMHDLRQEFGTNWKGRPRVLRQLKKTEWNTRRPVWYMENPMLVRTWFDVPDLRIATWLSLKYGIAVELSNNNNGK
jgi:hypothetical protein